MKTMAAARKTEKLSITKFNWQHETFKNSIIIIIITGIMMMLNNDEW